MFHNESRVKTATVRNVIVKMGLFLTAFSILPVSVVLAEEASVRIIEEVVVTARRREATWFRPARMFLGSKIYSNRS